MAADKHFFQFLKSFYQQVNNRQVFVVMPFAERFSQRYEKVIKAPLLEAGYEVIRADEIYGTNPIMENIVGLLQNSGLVIADLTGRNPNVLYELGLACGFGKKLLLLATTEEDIPTDLKHLTFILLENITEELAGNLVKQHVTNITSEEQEVSAISMPQRLLLGAHTLGIEDIVPADANLLAKFAFEARVSIDAIGLTGRGIFEVDMANLRALINHIHELSTRILLSHPESLHGRSIDNIDGSGSGATAMQLNLSAHRLKSLGLEVRFNREFTPWGGVFFDRKLALIQFFHPSQWNTKYLLVTNVPSGLFYSLQAKYDQLYEDSEVA